MAALPPFSERRRPRPGTLERPVNGRMYRGTWLLVGIPLLLAAFTVYRPQPLRAPQLPPDFDRTAAVQLATDFAHSYPDRFPGSQGGRQAARWVADQLSQYGLATESDRFHVKIPGHGRVELQNVVAVRRGSSPQAIAVVAHRDNTGRGPGANDNASGTAALLELARLYATPASAPQPLGPNHTILFVSTDGGSFGGLGAEHFVEHSPYRDRLVAAVGLDAIAGHAGARLQVAGDRPRSPAAPLVRTAATRLLEQTGSEPARSSGLAQLIDLAFPFSLFEQAPFVGHSVPAITITTAGDRPPPAFGDSPGRLNAVHLGEIGRAAQALLGSFDLEVELAQGTSSYLYLGSRVVRGWAIVFILGTALLPCLAVVVDLFARLRRRRIPLAPALRSYASRLGFWLFAALLFELFALVGIWERGAARPLSPENSPGTDWPLGALAVFTGLLAIGWIVARDRLLPRRAVAPAEELAGETAALLVLAVVTLLLVAINPFSVIFVLPSLHAWIWLPQLRGRPLPLRAAVLVAGFAGPLLLLGSFAFRFHLGLDAPWYIAELAAVSFVPFPSLLVFCAWLAVAAQLAAVTAGRYAPYPTAAERPPRGPVRAVVRAAALAVRERRRAADVERAVGG